MGYRENLRRGGIPAVLATALLLLGGSRLGAQDFERTFGRSDVEIGQAIVQTSDGGYITAGYTTNASNTQIAYVVRMQASGATAWERRFSVGGGSTSGIDIKQLSNGDHILVGTAVSASTGNSHIYALRFTDNGEIIWYRTYGEVSGNQYATGVVETTIAKTAPDDVRNLVISGYTLDDTGERRGLLMRLWADGSIRWNRLYDVLPATVNDNRLLSVDESRIGAGAGDIVATGYSNQPGASGDDVWVLRVDGPTGNITAGLQGSALFYTSAADRGHSIQELRLGNGAGDLVIAGESRGRRGTTESEILMLETRPAPCDPLGQWADQFQGEEKNLPNVARCVREITSSKLGKPGDVIVTGNSFTSAFGSSNDMFMQQFAQRTMLPVGRHYVFGGSSEDMGFAIATAENPSGYIATGFTTSVPVMPPLHQADLYTVRTGTPISTCTSTPVTLSSEAARLSRKCAGATITSPQWTVLCSGGSDTPNWGSLLCEE